MDQQFMVRRAHLAQLFVSSAACAGALAGLSRDRTIAGIVDELTRNEYGYDSNRANEIARNPVDLVYASQHDADFRETMENRAALMGARVMAFRTFTARRAGAYSE